MDEKPKKIFKKNEERFGKTKKALTFATPIKKVRCNKRLVLRKLKSLLSKNNVAGRAAN
ncbi:MAG TPA: hypothetical protein VHB48_15910 [Chitinophagaceae bacterium]|nr:hypothetical protein [Chitinophagaceae bacterium]